MRHLYTIQGVTVSATDRDDAVAQLREVYGDHDFSAVAQVPDHTVWKLRDLDAGTESFTTAAEVAERGRGFPYGLGALVIDGVTVWPR